jgi:DNA (cytosine-5)-methyltransferase 1
MNGHSPWRHKDDILKRMKKVPEGGQWEGEKTYFSQSYGRLHRKGLARTITRYFSNPGSGRFWHPTENRALTLREAARIQGFPDSFEFIEDAFASENCTLVGNALDAKFAEVAYLTIKNSIL